MLQTLTMNDLKSLASLEGSLVLSFGRSASLEGLSGCTALLSGLQSSVGNRGVGRTLGLHGASSGLTLQYLRVRDSLACQCSDANSTAYHRKNLQTLTLRYGRALRWNARWKGMRRFFLFGCCLSRRCRHSR